MLNEDQPLNTRIKSKNKRLIAVATNLGRYNIGCLSQLDLAFECKMSSSYAVCLQYIRNVTYNETYKIQITQRKLMPSSFIKPLYYSMLVVLATLLFVISDML